MAMLPDKLLIVRHGSRLDETMPAIIFRDVDAGYDTPLTYGGFKQSQALGAQIAHLLLLPGNPDRRRKRIIIHSSPFTRCVQTSIGIAAGMAQIVAPAINTVASQNDLSSVTRFASPYPRILLRLDPWLGEWMTEQYFEHWDAALLRSSALVARARNLLNGTANAEGIRVEANARPVAAPFNTTTDTKTDVRTYSMPARLTADCATYQCPKPNHAVLATDAIPAGYVAHARDHCIDFDETWVGLRDGGIYGETWSAFHTRIGTGLRELLNWYAGHHSDPTSFRSHHRQLDIIEHPIGLDDQLEDTTNAADLETREKRPTTTEGHAAQSEISTTGADEANVAASLSALAIDGSDMIDSTSDDELILILVTHAGGCNKLLHSLTQKPVLVDFPHSALSMALRNVDVTKAEPIDNLSSQYKMILQASTDHLNSTAKFRTVRELATISNQPLRHSRSSSRTNRRTNLTSVPPTATSQPGGLWGQTGVSPGGSMSAFETRPPSQSGLWRPQGAAPIRRATMDHLETSKDLP